MAEGTRIVLVRHGESRAQELGILGGHNGCQGLSATGRLQVEALRDRLATTGELAGASALYSSVMPRAVETAEILAPALGGLPLRSECDFCEGHPGEADGLTWQELDERFPPDDDVWRRDTRRAPGWETWQEMGERVAGALEGVVARHPGESVVIACHGGVVVHAMLHFLDLHEVSKRAWFDATNTSLTEFRFAANPYAKDTLPVQLVRYNDHAHLAGMRSL